MKCKSSRCSIKKHLSVTIYIDYTREYIQYIPKETEMNKSSSNFPIYIYINSQKKTQLPKLIPQSSLCRAIRKN